MRCDATRLVLGSGAMSFGPPSGDGNATSAVTRAEATTKAAKPSTDLPAGWRKLLTHELAD